MNAKTLLVVVLSLSSLVLCWACDGVEMSGAASCEEDCADDTDCQSGYMCTEMTSGTICVPDGCDACFSESKSCSWDENTDEQAEGMSKECTFRECM